MVTLYPETSSFSLHKSPSDKEVLLDLTLISTLKLQNVCVRLVRWKKSVTPKTFEK